MTVFFSGVMYGSGEGDGGGTTTNNYNTYYQGDFYAGVETLGASPQTLAADDVNKRYLMESADPYVLNLPPAIGDNKPLAVHKNGAGALTINADGTDTINGFSESGGTIANLTDQTDVFVVLVSLASGAWSVVNSLGSWGITA